MGRTTVLGCLAFAAGAALASGASLRPFGGAVPAGAGLPGAVGAAPRPSSANCTLYWHNQTLDHFSWVPGPGNQTSFNQRVFVCGQDNWKPPSEAFAKAYPDAVREAGASRGAQKATCGPVFFYTGNEADVYVNETGLMWEHAQEFGALMVFAEHRYFGETLPFGFDFKMDPEHMRYLSVEQALADYAALILHLRREVWHCDPPIVAFGGSYGGMLASWLRIKYSSAVDGSVAGSAPILAFDGEEPAVKTDYFASIETYDASADGLGSAECVTQVRDGFAALFRLGNSASGRSTVTSSMRLCTPLKSADDAAAVAGWAANGFSFLTMGSYPYASSYMLNGGGTLPPYPMKDVCARATANTGSGDAALMARFGSAIGVWFNFSGSATCLDWAAGAPNKQTEIDGELWDYLACTEMVMPMSQTGTTDMFWPQPWDEAAYSDGCFQRWGIRPRPLWAQASFGGRRLAGASNIVFSSGEFDPWRGADVVDDVSTSLRAVLVEKAGHHMDLMFSNPLDNKTNVVAVRKQELDLVASWIAQAYARE
ncbi:PRCP [Symbiodinium sp. KB8]|nr:PRCP [Symbiodinium sp. KB8]